MTRLERVCRDAVGGEGLQQQRERREDDALAEEVHEGAAEHLPREDRLGRDAKRAGGVDSEKKPRPRQ